MSIMLALILVLAVWHSAATPSSSIPAVCDVVVVGAGAGGAYAAWRLADSHAVCVFERAARPGGRVHSLRQQGPRQDLVVEAGAYRFAPQEVCLSWLTPPYCIRTPITAAVIQKLNLSSTSYNPDPRSWDHGLRKIVDAKGQDAGYLTFVESMLQSAVARGAHLSFGQTVESLVADSSGVTVRLVGGRAVRTAAVLLNLPQLPLLDLLRRSGPQFRMPFPMPLYSTVPYPLMKLYIHYDDAWWRNELGHISGYMDNKYTAADGRTTAPINGAYHDGDVRCDGPNGRCRGFLQTAYIGDAARIGYYAPFLSQLSLSGESALQLSLNDPEQRELLVLVHEALVLLHRPALDAINATARVKSMLPTAGVLSIWSQGVAGIGAGCHSRIPQVTAEGLAQAARRPFDGQPVYVANEAWGVEQCFAEASLNMSEAAVQDLGLGLPGWLQLKDEVDLSSRAGGQQVPTDPFFMMPGVSVAPSRRPARALNITVLALLPYNQSGDVTDKNTADLAGDVFYYLADTFFIPYVCALTNNTMWECTGGMSQLLDPTNVYVAKVLEVDGSFGGCSSGDATCSAYADCIPGDERSGSPWRCFPMNAQPLNVTGKVDVESRYCGGNTRPAGQAPLCQRCADACDGVWCHWKSLLSLQTGGTWYSTPKEGACERQDSSCAWHVVATSKTVSASCANGHLRRAIERRASLNAKRPVLSCFDQCPHRHDYKSDCYILCALQTVFGRHPDSLNSTELLSPPMTKEELETPLRLAFESSDPAAGGCPALPPYAPAAMDVGTTTFADGSSLNIMVV